MEEFLENWDIKIKQLFTDWDEMNQNALNSIYKAYEDNSQQCIDQIQQMKNQLLHRKLINSMDEIENLIKENCITILGELQSQFENNLNYLDSQSKRINRQTPINNIVTLGFEKYICIQQQQQQPQPPSPLPPQQQPSPQPPPSPSPPQQQQQFDGNVSKFNHIFYYIKHHDIAMDDLIKFLQSEMKSNSTLNIFIDYLIKNIQLTGIITGNEMNHLNEINNNLSIKFIKKSIKSENTKTNDTQLLIINNNNNNENKPITVNNYVTDYIQPIKIEKCLNLIKHVKTIVRIKILGYLEQWKNTTILAVKEEVIVRKTEYQLQLKLHEPRIRRVKEAFHIQLDVANVRLTELVFHQTRIERHITSVNLILNEMKINSTKSLIETINKSEEQMDEAIK
ncbi:unnamed protein product [Schistosoma intercalatum]|nr:unnamed protein product [Schistosoma intercalatum]